MIPSSHAKVGSSTSWRSHVSAARYPAMAGRSASAALASDDGRIARHGNPVHSRDTRTPPISSLRMASISSTTSASRSLTGGAWYSMLRGLGHDPGDRFGDVLRRRLPLAHGPLHQRLVAVADVAALP